MTDSHVVPGRGTDAEEPSSISSSLLDRLKADSPEAWRRLAHLFGPLVYQWCRHNRLQPADANDVGQDVFRAVALKIGRFRRDRPGDTFRGWLWTITKHKIADHWRHCQGLPMARGGSSVQLWFADLPDGESEGLDQPSGSETPSSLYQRALELVQDDFELRTWKAFWRVVVDGCLPADVADELNVSANSVYLAKSRVLRRLHEELGDLFN